MRFMYLVTLLATGWVIAGSDLPIGGGLASCVAVLAVLGFLTGFLGGLVQSRTPWWEVGLGLGVPSWIALGIHLVTGPRVEAGALLLVGFAVLAFLVASAAGWSGRAVGDRHVARRAALAGDPALDPAGSRSARPPTRPVPSERPARHNPMDGAGRIGP